MSPTHQKIRVFGFIFFIVLSFLQSTTAQNRSYRNSILAFRHNYINTHEAIEKNDRKYIQFHEINAAYRVIAHFKKINDLKGFEMNTSSGMKKKFFKYGLLTFKLHDSLLHLFVYRSASLMQQKKYKNYLFIPFGDATSGFESYGGGRYIEFYITDIKNNRLLLDLNKAYNPNCAYATGYNCPIPPMENILKVSVTVGEKNFGKPVH